MSDACTIYVNRVDYQKVREVIETVSTNPVEVIGDGGHWQRITVRGKSTLTFTAMEGRPHEHDEFSDLVLGTAAFFRRIEPADAGLKAGIVTAISECRFALGVVGRPAFSEAEKHFDIVFAITEAFGGLIFNGHGMIDKNGLVVLDSDGNCDLI